MKKRKILFIINPHSGVKGKTDFPALVDSCIDKNTIEHEIAFTKAPKHAVQLSREAAGKGYDAVVAIGGDGSVNEVACGLVGTQTALGIIATGSGNGMARSMKIPMDYKAAMQVINAGRLEQIDTFKVNDRVCVGTMGVGFDAHTAHLFAKSTKRGLSSYVKIIFSEFYKYKPRNYEMKIDGEDVSKECFLLTIANSPQWGNNAMIAPFADVRDGILDISMIRKFPLLMTPLLIFRLMNSSIHRSGYFSMKRGKELVIKNNTEIQAHIDGEPVTFATDLHIQIVPSSLNVIVPQK